MANTDESQQPTEAAKQRTGYGRYFVNWMSISGLLGALTGFVIGLAFFIIDLMAKESPGYAGMSNALFLMLVIVGAVLMFWGAFRERWRLHKGGQPISLDRLIVNFSRISGWWLIVIVFVAMLLPLSIAVGSYRFFQATETNEFCGELCHSVMNPEYVTYHYSSHARVECVSCHIGSGAEWYVRSKISGLKQIVAVTLRTYPTPIPTPIHDLRPARDTCERCHWPSKFIGYKEFVRSYYLSDEENTPYKIRMLMKIGGERSKLVSGSGIHYHMLIASKVEYIARGERRQEIPWVRIGHGDGSVTTYENESNPLTEEEKQSLEVRVMDCMDCHNRPAHQFATPMKSVNASIEQGLIPRDLPYIKLEATKALDQPYENTETAMTGIANHLRNYYKEKNPDLLRGRSEDIRAAITEVQEIYRRSIFPEMKADWSKYPDNIGHRDWQGCFRCHNDEMKSKEGFNIFTTCDKCHLILAQGENVDQVASVDFLKGKIFKHPGEDGEEIQEYTECADCHTGGAETYE